MPVYEYACDCGHVTTVYQAPLNQQHWPCSECGKQARRRSFYGDTAVTRLPTRGPHIPPRPAARSTKGEDADTWKEIMDEYAHDSYQHDRKYGRGGELADRYEDRPKGTRDV